MCFLGTVMMVIAGLMLIAIFVALVSSFGFVGVGIIGIIILLSAFDWLIDVLSGNRQNRR